MLLGIDTSGAVSVALAEGALDAPTPPRVLARRGDGRARHHDEVLLALVDQVMREAGARREELAGIVVGRGPGPFTGLRVGLVVGRTLAAVLGVPLHGLCSLDALAHQALAEAEDPAAVATVAVALDARRREVYHARYRRTAEGTLERVAGPAVDAPAAVAADLTAADLLLGSGTALYPELLPASAAPVHADAGHLILAAHQAAARGEDLRDTAPLYLREPDAARPTAPKSALGR